MAKEDRNVLEMIAAEMLHGSMEYIGEYSFEDMLSAARELTDAELIDYIANI